MEDSYYCSMQKTNQQVRPVKLLTGLGVLTHACDCVADAECDPYVAAQSRELGGRGVQGPLQVPLLGLQRGAHGSPRQQVRPGTGRRRQAQERGQVPGDRSAVRAAGLDECVPCFAMLSLLLLCLTCGCLADRLDGGRGVRGREDRLRRDAGGRTCGAILQADRQHGEAQRRGVLHAVRPGPGVRGHHEPLHSGRGGFQGLRGASLPQPLLLCTTGCFALPAAG